MLSPYILEILDYMHIFNEPKMDRFYRFSQQL